MPEPLVAERDGEIAGHMSIYRGDGSALRRYSRWPRSPFCPASNDRGLNRLGPEGHRIAENWGTRIHWCWEGKRVIPRLGYIPANRSVWKSQTDAPANFLAVKLREGRSSAPWSRSLCERIRALSAIRADCGASFGKAGEARLWTLEAAGPCGCFKWFFK